MFDVSAHDESYLLFFLKGAYTEMTKQGLLIIDVQNDYFENGKMPLHNPDEALAHINLLERWFYEEDLPVFYIQHIFPNDDAAFFVHDTEGVQLNPQLKRYEQDPVITKQTPNSFFQTELATLLDENDVTDLVITGMMTHLCVDSTTRAAKELGYQSTLIHDATTTRGLSLNNQTVAPEDVQNAFISSLSNFAEIQSTNQFLSKQQ